MSRPKSYELRRKCAKCNITAAEDRNLSFHRFPLPGKHMLIKARVWAEYCYPTGEWSTEKSVKDLHLQHKMLCSKHFEDSSFTSSARTRLNNYAIPIGAEDLLIKYRQEQCATTSGTTQDTNNSVEEPQVPITMEASSAAVLVPTIKSEPTTDSLKIPSVDEAEAPADSRIAAPDPVNSSLSTSVTTPQSSTPNSISSEPLTDVEWLEDEILLPPPPSTQPAFPPSTETQPAEQQPHVTSRENRHAQRSTSAAQRSRSQRQIYGDERTPRWAYQLESRRIAAEERHATAMEALVDLIREIRNDIRICVNNLNSGD